MAPKRIQRKRQRGWRKPPNTVIVDRTSRFGNPFKMSDMIARGYAKDEEKARKVCVHFFRRWLMLPAFWPEYNKQRRWILDHIHELRGKDLACFCKEGEVCHADILLDMAAETEDDNAARET